MEINGFDKLIALKAQNALREELNTSVKFGLVCPSHNGSHSDLDFALMNASIDALGDGFATLTATGRKIATECEENALALARSAGLKTEKDMFAATDGRNTHKGAIFCLGLFCVAVGRQKERGESFDAAGCGDFIAKTCAGMCKRELENVRTPLTHGEKVFARYGASGARGLAENGFDVVTGDFLPTAEKIFSEATDFDAAKTRLLAYIVSKTDDVNVLYRADADTLKSAQTLCGDLYRNFDVQKAKQTEKWFIEKNVSCGGSADLLSLTLFLIDLKSCNAI